MKSITLRITHLCMWLFHHPQILSHIHTYSFLANSHMWSSLHIQKWSSHTCIHRYLIKMMHVVADITYSSYKKGYNFILFWSTWYHSFYSFQSEIGAATAVWWNIFGGANFRYYSWPTGRLQTFQPTKISTSHNLRVGNQQVTKYITMNIFLSNHSRFSWT